MLLYSCLFSLAEYKEQEKGRVLGSSCKGRAYLEYSRKTTLWGINWVFGGQWLPAVVRISNVCFKCDPELWVLHPLSPALYVSIKSCCSMCLLMNYVHLLSVWVSFKRKKTPQLLEWERTWNRFEDCTGKIIPLNLLLERIHFSATKDIIHLLPLPSGINTEQKYFAYEMHILSGTLQVVYSHYKYSERKEDPYPSYRPTVRELLLLPLFLVVDRKSTDFWNYIISGNVKGDFLITVWNSSKHCPYLEVKFKGRDSKDVIVHLREVFWESSAWKAKRTNCWGVYEGFKWSLWKVCSAVTREWQEQMSALRKLKFPMFLPAQAPGCERPQESDATSSSCAADEEEDGQRMAADTGVRIDIADIERREMNTKKISWSRNPGEYVKCSAGE